MSQWHFLMRLAVACILLAAGASSIYADQRLDRIKDRYAAAGELECEAGCEHFRHTVTYNTMLPAVGLQTTTLTFYYLSDQADPEGDPYLLTRELVKVKVTYNVAASAFYSIEYLYDNQGAPMFYYWKEETNDAPGEKRYYFSGGALIRAAVDYHDQNGRKSTYVQDRDFSREDVTAAGAVLKQASDYKKLFDTLLQAEEWR
jgi:hypothetical protein